METKISLKPITLTFTLTRTYTPTDSTFEDWDIIPTQKAFEGECMDDFFDEVDLCMGSYQTQSVERTYQDPVEINFNTKDEIL